MSQMQFKGNNKLMSFIWFIILCIDKEKNKKPWITFLFIILFIYLLILYT